MIHNGAIVWRSHRDAGRIPKTHTGIPSRKSVSSTVPKSCVECSIRVTYSEISSFALIPEYVYLESDPAGLSSLLITLKLSVFRTPFHTRPSQIPPPQQTTQHDRTTPQDHAGSPVRYLSYLRLQIESSDGIRHNTFFSAYKCMAISIELNGFSFASYSKPETWEIVEVPLPTLRSGDVLIKVKASLSHYAV